MQPLDDKTGTVSRRTALALGVGAAAVPLLSSTIASAKSAAEKSALQGQGTETMTFVETKDGTQIF